MKLKKEGIKKELNVSLAYSKILELLKLILIGMGKYLLSRCINGNTDIIFRSGKWAEIIEEPKTEPTKEEINRVLTFLKIKNEQ